MLAIRVVAIALIVASTAGLAVSGFDELRNVPGHAQLASGMEILMWIAASGLFLGGLLLVGFATRRR